MLGQAHGSLLESVGKTCNIEMTREREKIKIQNQKNNFKRIGWVLFSFFHLVLIPPA